MTEPLLTCKFNEPWIGEHPLCQREADRLCGEFDAAVVRGEFDTAGFTPNERKAQARRTR